MSSRYFVAYAVWLGSFALFAWLTTVPGGGTLVALVASVAVLSWTLTRWVSRDSESSWRS